MIVKNTLKAWGCIQVVAAQALPAEDNTFEENFSDQYDLTAFTKDANGNSIGDDESIQRLQGVFADGQQCFGTMVAKYGVEQETKSFLEFINSEEWIKTAELGTDDEFNQ